MGKNIIEFQNIFDSTLRIQMLASLSISPMTFKQLKTVCQCTDGSTKHHVEKLITSGLVVMDKLQKDEIGAVNDNGLSLEKAFYHQQVTVYRITEFGKAEYTDFVETIVSQFNRQAETEKENLIYEKNIDLSR